MRLVLLQLWLDCQEVIQFSSFVSCELGAKPSTKHTKQHEKNISFRAAWCCLVDCSLQLEALRFSSFQPVGNTAAARTILMMSPGMNLSTVI